MNQLLSRKLGFVVLAMFATLCVPLAHADTYTYTFTGLGTLSGTEFVLTDTSLIPLQEDFNVADLVTSSTGIICTGFCGSGTIAAIFFDGGSCGDILGGNPTGTTFFCTAGSSVGFPGTFSLTPGTSTLSDGTLVVRDVTTTGTPEPRTVGVMLTGIGFMLVKRKSVATRVLQANQTIR